MIITSFVELLKLTDGLRSYGFFPDVNIQDLRKWFSHNPISRYKVDFEIYNEDDRDTIDLILGTRDGSRIVISYTRDEMWRKGMR